MCGQTTGAKAPIVVLSATDFLAYDLPKREYNLDPILPGQGLALLYAPRGLGKTFLTLTLAYGVAAGHSVLRWNAPRLEMCFSWTAKCRVGCCRNA